MNPWWSEQEFYCKCQGNDRWVHVHRAEGTHSCARCSECTEYRPNIPEHVGTRILLGPEMLESTAADILLGTAPTINSTQELVDAVQELNHSSTTHSLTVDEVEVWAVVTAARNFVEKLNEQIFVHNV